MSVLAFRDEVLRTCPSISTDTFKDKLFNGALGLTGESGEVADMLKKSFFQGKPFDRDEFLKELGDVRWYLEYLMIAVDTTLEEVEAINVAKLRKRYPNGFTYLAAAERADEQRFRICRICGRDDCTVIHD